MIPNMYVETRHHSRRFSTQSFAAITYRHHTPLIRIQTRPQASAKTKRSRRDGFRAVLQTYLRLPGDKEDGNSAHRSAYTVKERAELGVRKIPWPARSPDLNPIENVCVVING